MTTEQIKFITQQIYSRYFGQKVLSGKSFSCIPLDYSFFNNKHVGEFYLQLRSIEALTDDEHITLAKMDYRLGIDELAMNREKRINWGRNNKYFIIEQARPFQYLVQKSVALLHYIILPNGETFTASVEWQVEQGIIKLTK